MIQYIEDCTWAIRSDFTVFVWIGAHMVFFSTNKSEQEARQKLGAWIANYVMTTEQSASG